MVASARRRAWRGLEALRVPSHKGNRAVADWAGSPEAAGHCLRLVGEWLDRVAEASEAQLMAARTGWGTALSADPEGFFSAEDLPTGAYSVEAFSQDGRRRGTGIGEAVSGHTAFFTVTLNGTGVVVGRVENSSGQPVAQALVAGGDGVQRARAHACLQRRAGIGQHDVRAQ